MSGCQGSQCAEIVKKESSVWGSVQMISLEMEKLKSQRKEKQNRKWAIVSMRDKDP